MSFNPNIPQVTDSTLQSFSQLRANFQAIAAAFADNHVGLTRTSDVMAKHTVLTMQPQTSDPATSATQVAIYNKLVSSIPELFYRPSSSATPIQMTYPTLRTGLQTTNPNVYFPTQYSFVAGPFIIYSGFIKAPTNGQPVTLTPGTTLLFVDLIAANSNIAGGGPGSPPTNAYAVPTGVSGTTFTIQYNPPPVGGFDVYYFAIGQ